MQLFHFAWMLFTTLHAESDAASPTPPQVQVSSHLDQVLDMILK